VTVAGSGTPPHPEIDPITFEVLNNAFRSIVDEMGALLQSVAFSLVVSEGRDYSGTICRADGDLVSSGSTDLPAHLGTIPYTVKGMLEWIGVPAEEYFDLAANWAITEKAGVTLGINNVLDDNPSISGAVGTNGNGNTFPQSYDALGRYVFVRATVDF